MSSPGELILPRPGAPRSSHNPIPGPTEAAFTEIFGSLLPPAKFLHTTVGKAAYYELLPSSPSESVENAPNRVLLVHGIQTPALGMLPLGRALQSSFPHAHLVLVDLWGHGLSDTPILPHDADLFHQLLDSLLDQLDWPSAHLVGYSFGGATTVGYGASRSSRVQSLAIVAPVGLIRSSDFSAEQQGYLRGDNEAAARKWIFELLEGGELVVPADWKQRVANGDIVAEALREWQLREHAGHAASVIAIFRDGEVMDIHTKYLQAERAGIPSLVVLGELDDFCKEREFKEHGFANIAVVPQVGHGVVRERVPEVAALISKFWTNLPVNSSIG